MKNLVPIPRGAMQTYLRSCPTCVGLHPFTIACKNGAFLTPINPRLKNVDNMGRRMAKRIYQTIQNSSNRQDTFEAMTVGQRGLPRWYLFCVTPVPLLPPWQGELWAIQFTDNTTSKIGALFTAMFQSQASPFAWIMTNAHRNPGSIVAAYGCEHVFGITDGHLIGKDITTLKDRKDVDAVRQETARDGMSWTGIVESKSGSGALDSFVFRDGPVRHGIHRKAKDLPMPFFGESVPPAQKFQQLLNEMKRILKTTELRDLNCESAGPSAKKAASKLKEPSDKAIEAYRQLFGGRNQKQVAQDFYVDQGTISRWKTGVAQWIAAGHVLPDPPKPITTKPIPMDPAQIDLGQRRDHRSPHQRGRHNSDRDD